MIAQRYMHLSGVTSRDFGAVSVADRRHAANNPKAYFYGKPITIEDHQSSLEELGFCGQGEAKDYVVGGAIELGGRLPINTRGGQLGEAYMGDLAGRQNANPLRRCASA